MNPRAFVLIAFATAAYSVANTNASEASDPTPTGDHDGEPLTRQGDR